MNKNYVLSGIVGGIFFVVPYIGLGVGLVPSLITAGIAFGAGSLITKPNQDALKKLGIKNYELYKRQLEESNQNLQKIRDLISKIDDKEINNSVQNITKTADKVISVLNEKPNKINQATNFLNYYLPVTLKILMKYEEFEEGNLTSKESKDFMMRMRKLIFNIQTAFENQLNYLYNTDMVDTNAEMKVFEQLLKTDGLLGDSILVKDRDDNNE